MDVLTNDGTDCGHVVSEIMLECGSVDAGKSWIVCGECE